MKADIAVITLASAFSIACAPVQDPVDVDHAGSLQTNLTENDIAALLIFQSCGVDQRVNYSSLTRYGPWDDRNYDLTADDIDYLSPDEHELRDPVPAFFRVELRKEIPGLATSGPAQYPRSAVPLFGNRYGQLKNEIKTESDCLGKK